MEVSKLDYYLTKFVVIIFAVIAMLLLINGLRQTNELRDRPIKFIEVEKELSADDRDYIFKEELYFKFQTFDGTLDRVCYPYGSSYGCIDSMDYDLEKLLLDKNEVDFLDRRGNIFDIKEECDKIDYVELQTLVAKEDNTKVIMVEKIINYKYISASDVEIVAKRG